MKLMQYGFLGVPPVCPRVTVGDRPGRFGHEPGDATALKLAIEGALECRAFAQVSTLTWPHMVDLLREVA